MLVKKRAYFKEVPAIRLCLWFCLGIVMANYKSEFSIYIVSSLVVFSAVFTLLLKTHKSFIINALIISSGFLLFLLHQPSAQQSYLSHKLNSERFYIGTIDAEPKAGKSIRTRIKISLSADSCLQWRPTTGNIVAYIREDSLSASINIGQSILFKGLPSRIQKNQNPLAFDFQRYMNYQGVEYQIFLNPDSWKIIKEPERSFKNLTSNLRQYCINTLDKYIANEDNKAIASAMLLGYRNNLSEEIYTAYTDTGAVHVLAVSGLHVGIVNMLLLYCLIFLPKRRRWASIIKALLTISGIWLFAFLTGAAPAVLRASVMFSLFTLGRIFLPKMNSYNILGSSALILLLYNPFLLFQGSFQFSYLALLSILYFQPKINKWYRPRFWLDRQIWGLLTVAISAQILVFPVTIYYFHKFAASFWISGIAVIGLAFVIIALGILVLISSAVSDIATQWIAWSLERILHLFVGIIKNIQKLPYSSLDDLWLSESQMYILYAALLLIMCWITFQSRKWIYPILLAIITFLMISLNRNVETSQQRFMIVYDVQRELIIDLVHGHQCYEYKSNDENEKLLKFARANHRLSKNISSITSLASTYTDQLIYKRGGVIMFDKAIIAIADKEHHEWRYLDSIDYLVLGNVYTDSFLDIIKDKRINQIIISNKMYPKWSKRLRNILSSSDISYQFTGDQAVVINF